MSSMDTDSSERALMNLIYQHLKDNGYKKAASALKKHVPQVEAANVKGSLDDIFKKWVSDEQEKKPNNGKDLQKSPKSASNTARNSSPKKNVKPQTRAVSRYQEGKSEDGTKTCKSSSSTESQTVAPNSTIPKTEDSDSDSSLDVEKWKQLALQIADADIAKVDAFANCNTSTAKSTTRRKPAQPKKKQEQTRGNAQRSSRKTKAKVATKTDKIKTPLTPTMKETVSSCESDKYKTPSKKAVVTETNIKTPESKKAISLSDEVSTPKTDVSNGLSESVRYKVKRKKTHGVLESHDIETPGKEPETEETDVTSKPKPTDTPCKKTKSKKDLQVAKPGSLETSSGIINPEVAIKKCKSGLNPAEVSKYNGSKQSECVSHSKSYETKMKKDKSKNCIVVGPVYEDAAMQTDIICAPSSVTDLNTAETPKKAKSRKSKTPQDLGDVPVASEEYQIKDNEHDKLHHTETVTTSLKEVKPVMGSEPIEKPSNKARRSFLEPNETEKPSMDIETQAATTILEPLISETPSKKSKSKKSSKANKVDSPSINTVLDIREDEVMKSSSSKSDKSNIFFKTSKRKRTDSSGENMTSSVDEDVPPPSSECHNVGVDDSFTTAGNISQNQSQESVSAVEEEGTPGPKKRKKKKKDKEENKNESDDTIEQVPPTPPAEECTDSLRSSGKKKKKKKQKHTDDEMADMATPYPEEDIPKKKNKTSKKKEHAEVSEQGFI